METTFSAPGITCQGCAGTIERALAAVRGVSGVEVDVPTKTVRVVHDGAASPEALALALAGAGYPASGPANGACCSAGAPAGVKDPVCGMSVDPAAAAG